MDPEDAFHGHRGEAAALATAVCWSLTPFFFTAASRRIGGFSANVIRLVLATLLLSAAVVITGSLEAIPSRQTALLAASGFIGLTLGDAALFEAFVILGPRRVSLLGAVAPILVAVLSIPMLGEGLSATGIAGMALTLGGVAWVIGERPAEGEVKGNLARGIVMGVLAAAGQGLGALCVKAGLGDAPSGTWLGDVAADADGVTSVSPLLGSLVRMVTGTAGMLLWAVFRGRLREVASARRDPGAVALTSGGAFFGPFVGVWLSLVAFKHTKETAVAQTIMAFSPVIVILIARIVHGDRPSVRAWIGSFVAVAGVAVLTFRDQIGAAFSG